MTRTPSWPAPWQEPILFQTPFTLDATRGRALVVDFVSRGYSGSSWFAEGYMPHHGEGRSDFIQAAFCRTNSTAWARGELKFNAAQKPQATRIARVTKIRGITSCSRADPPVSWPSAGAS